MKNPASKHWKKEFCIFLTKFNVPSTKSRCKEENCKDCPYKIPDLQNYVKDIRLWRKKFYTINKKWILNNLENSGLFLYLLEYANLNKYSVGDTIWIYRGYKNGLEFYNKADLLFKSNMFVLAYDIIEKKVEIVFNYLEAIPSFGKVVYLPSEKNIKRIIIKRR